MANSQFSLDTLLPRSAVGLVLAWGLGSAGAATLAVAPSGADTGNCQSSACATITYALSQAATNDTIQLAAGSYIEQLTINKSVTITGAGMAQSFIKAPATLVTNPSVPAVSGTTASKTAIVFVDQPGTKAVMKNLAVSGPNATNCALGYGIFVGGTADLTLDTVHVKDVRNDPFSGCGNGKGVSFGAYTSAPENARQVGTGQVLNSVIDGFNKNGIEVFNTGSHATLRGNTVTGIATNQIAQNGIIIADGATALIDGNTISGMQCNVASCLAGTYWSIGLTLEFAGSPVQITNNNIQGADGNIVTVLSSATVTGNKLSNARYANMQAWGGTFDMQANVLSGSVDGLQVRGYGGTTLVNLDGGNTIQGASGTGVAIRNSGTSPTVQGSKNQFFGNGTGATNTNGVADLACNWWGNFKGPQHTTTNPNGAGNAVGDSVTYTKWAVDNRNFECVGDPAWVDANPNGPVVNATPVPVDSPWAMAGLALALAGLGATALRRRQNRA